MFAAGLTGSERASSILRKPLRRGQDECYPIVLVSAVTTLAFAALIAAVIPARRAASIEPVKALRVE